MGSTRGLLAVAVGLVVALPAAGATPATPADRTLAGTVRDPLGRPLEACVVAHLDTPVRSVTLEDPVNDTYNPDHADTSAPDGSFSVELKAGPYEVLFDDAGGDPADPCSAGFLNSRLARTVIEVDLTLESADALDVTVPYFVGTNNTAGHRPGHGMRVSAWIHEDAGDPADLQVLWRDVESDTTVELTEFRRFWQVGSYWEYWADVDVPASHVDGPHEVEVWAVDRATGTQMTNTRRALYFTDSVAPTLVSTDPADGESGVDRHRDTREQGHHGDVTGFVFKFRTDESVRSYESTVELYDMTAGAAVAPPWGGSSVEWGTGRNAYETRAVYELETGHTYEAAITLTDLAGNVGGPYTTTFTTAA